MKSVSADHVEDVRLRMTHLADHYLIAGIATRHDVESRAYGKGYSDAWREAAAYLRDLLLGAGEPDPEEEME